MKFIHKPARGALAVLSIAAAGILLVGCSAQATKPTANEPAWKKVLPGISQKLVDQANKEGTLTLYTGTWSASTDAEIAAFNKLFPNIKVQTYENSSSSVEQKFLAEERAGTYTADVYDDADTDSMTSMVKEKLLAKYKVASDANFAAADKLSGYWYSLRKAMVGIAWNTDLVTDKQAASLTWKSASSPTWKGKIGLQQTQDGQDCTIACLASYYWGLTYGDSFLKKVAANDPQWYTSATPAAAALAAGDVSIIFNASETSLTPLFDQGAPIKWVLPSPGIGQDTGQAVVAHAPHPAAAELYQAYSFTKQGYTIWQQSTGIPTWIGMANQTAVSKETWYKTPTKYFTPKTPGDPNSRLSHTNQMLGLSS
jgi:iron(III) transport system substrate-binding protein